jgi:dTDP-4-dehydrorhamnose reductase
VAPDAHWFVTGSYGQLGSALLALLAESGTSASGCDIDELDVADPEAVRARIEQLPRPLVWANAAAFTQVDRCEREPELARRANALAPAVLAEVCAETGARLVHVSTDYVFPGDADRPYREDDPTGPRSVYGRTKLEGEEAVLSACEDFLVVRTSWVFGAGRNFIAAVLEQAARRRDGSASGPLRVVDDQTGRPTYAVDLARALVALVGAGARGLVHFANAGAATWWELARYALDRAGYRDVAIDRIRTDDLHTDARRPTWSVLDTSRAEALGVKPRRWQDAVDDYLQSDHAPPAARAEGALRV